MTNIDPIQLAKKLERLGLVQEAIAMLQRAQIDNPDRAELRRMEEDLRRAASTRGRLLVGLHLAMAWLLLLTAAAAVFGPCIWVLRHIDEDAIVAYPPWSLLATLIAAVGGLVLFIQLWILLFLFAWICYLKHVAKRDRRQVELRLPSIINMVALQPMHGAIRRRFFADEQT